MCSEIKCEKCAQMKERQRLYRSTDEYRAKMREYHRARNRSLKEKLGEDAVRAIWRQRKSKV